MFTSSLKGEEDFSRFAVLVRMSDVVDIRDFDVQVYEDHFAKPDTEPDADRIANDVY